MVLREGEAGLDVSDGGIGVDRREDADGEARTGMLPGAAEPSPVSPTQSASYQLINRTMRQLFPDVLVAPGLMVAATDSRHFTALSDHVYRFSPVRARPEDLSRFHGTNERIATANLAEIMRFYHQLLSNTSAPAN